VDSGTSPVDPGSLLLGQRRWARPTTALGDEGASENTISRKPRRGDRSPGRTGHRRPETGVDVTDRFDGNSLEDDNLARGGTSGGPRHRVTGEPTAGRRRSSRGGSVTGNARLRPCRKRDEPQGRQQDATSLRVVRGESRRSGAKPQGRNGTSGLASRGRRSRPQGLVREWTRTVTSREASARTVDGGATGRGGRVT
jgi:hypothetical protein